MTTDPLAQAAMVAYCGWDPTAVVTDAVLTLDGTGTSLAFLPSLHVTDVSAVTVTYSDGLVYDAIIGADGDIVWSENGTLRWLPTSMQFGVFPAGTANIAVTYSGGYTEVPADLAAALDSLSGRMPTIQSAVTQAKIGTAVITRGSAIAEGGLLLVEQMVFDRYRIVKAA